MINTAKYFEDAIAFLTNQDTEGFNRQFVYQQEDLNSQDYNYNMLNIENNLNLLYQKARVLQDVITYAREYVTQNIYSTADECKAILSSIEDNVDSLKGQNYITIPVTFEESTGSYLDRNRKRLPKTSVYNSTLTLSGKVNTLLKIKDVKLTAGLKPYRENISNLKEAKPYRSFYLLDNPIKDGLKEMVKIDFTASDVINQLDIVNSNSKVSNVKYINANDTVDLIEDHSSVFQTNRTVKAIEFINTIENYNKLTYYVDQSRIKPNFWDTIGQYEYEKKMGIATTLTQAQIDEMSGLSAFKTEYAAYVAKVNKWIEDRQMVVDTNLSNGYTDAMPTVDFIVAPDMIKDITNATIAPTPPAVTSTTIAGSVYKNVAASTAPVTGIISNPTTVVRSYASVVRTPEEQIYPDSEKIVYQQSRASYSSSSKALTKTGSIARYYTSSPVSASYSRSVKTK